MPDNYSSYLAKCVDVDTTKISGLKSHDCHVFMQSLLPIAFSALPEQIWKPLTELSQFFRDLCSTVLLIKYEAKLGGPVQYRWMYPFER